MSSQSHHRAARITFWKWFFQGLGHDVQAGVGSANGSSRPGYQRFADLWSVFHVGVGFVCVFVVRIPLFEAANSVLLPLAGALVGMTFAWIGNAQALLRLPEIERLAKAKGEYGFADYVFVFQAAILLVLFSLAFWAFAGMKVFDETWPTPANPLTYDCIKLILFLSVSMTFRECWHVILGTMQLMLKSHELKDRR